MSDYTGKRFDTHATTTYLVKLATDPKVFPGREGKPEDVILGFADNSWMEKAETLWVDAQIANFQSQRAKGYRKGDQVQVTGKLHFLRDKEGNLRGKMFGATVQSFVNLKERGETVDSTPAVPPAFA